MSDKNLGEDQQSERSDKENAKPVQLDPDQGERSDKESAKPVQLDPDPQGGQKVK